MVQWGHYQLAGKSMVQWGQLRAQQLGDCTRRLVVRLVTQATETAQHCSRPSGSQWSPLHRGLPAEAVISTLNSQLSTCRPCRARLLGVARTVSDGHRPPLQVWQVEPELQIARICHFETSA